MTEDQFEKLARLIKETAEETREEPTRNSERRLTGAIGSMKEGFAAIHTDIRGIHTPLDTIDARLDVIEANIAAMKGYSVEIDELRAEITAIKKDLGLPKKLAA